jgi:PKD repeat protein
MVNYKFLLILLSMLILCNSVNALTCANYSAQKFGSEYVNFTIIGPGGGGNGGRPSDGYWGNGGGAGEVNYTNYINASEGVVFCEIVEAIRGASYGSYTSYNFPYYFNTSIWIFGNTTEIGHASAGHGGGNNFTIPGSYSVAAGQDGYTGIGDTRVPDYTRSYIINTCDNTTWGGSREFYMAQPGISTGNTQIGAAGKYCGGGGGGGLYDGIDPVNIRNETSSIRAGGTGGYSQTFKSTSFYTPTNMFYSDIQNTTTYVSINFFANSSYANTYQWTFGDGTSSTLENPSHSYSSIGSYNISLTTSNSFYTGIAYIRTLNGYVNIVDTTPYAQFSGNVTYGISPLDVEFFDETNSTTTAWNWTFGGSNFSSLQNPKYTFVGTGKYNVTLNATNSAGYNITRKVDYVNVSASLYNPTSYISITPSVKDIGIAQYGIVTLNVRNITAQSIYVDLGFNKSNINIISAINNFSAYPGLSVTPVYDNTNGHVGVDVARIDGTTMYFGNTITPIVDLNFTTISYDNGTAPLSYLSANELMNTGDREGIVMKVPGVINTVNALFNFDVYAYNIATNAKITSMVKFNATGNNVNPTDVETDTGMASFSSNYGKVAFNLTAQGYYPLAQSANITSDATVILKMTSYSGSTQTTWYSPHQVRITVLDSYYGKKMYGTTIEVSPLTNTFPSGAQSDWITSMFGVNAAAANDMMNGTLMMSGVTDGDGSVVFTMLSSIGYTMHITNTTTGIDHTVKIFPIENDYNIWADTTENSAIANPNFYNYNTTLTYEAPNLSYSKFGVVYQDTTGKTTSVTFNVTCITNNTRMYSETLSGFGTSPVFANYTIKIKNGEQYTWKYNATRVV